MIQVRDLNKKDLKYCANVLTLALEKDPMYVSLFSNEKKREKYLQCFFEMRIRYGLNYGKVYVTSDKYEGIIILLPGDDFMTPKKVFSCGGLKVMLTLGKGNMNKLVNIMNYLEEKERECMNGDFVKVSPLGINPIFQNKGYARSMLDPILDELENNNKTCYLETQNPVNIPFYENFGFNIINEGYMPLDRVKYWCLKK